MNKFIYLVERGSYSDREILCGFTRKEDAEAFAMQWNQAARQDVANADNPIQVATLAFDCDDLEILKVPIDRPGHEGCSAYCVEMDRDGLVVKCDRTKVDMYSWGGHWYFLQEEDASSHTLGYEVMAVSPDQAIQLTDTQRLELLAKMAWPL